MQIRSAGAHQRACILAQPFYLRGGIVAENRFHSSARVPFLLRKTGDRAAGEKSAEETSRVPSTGYRGEKVDIAEAPLSREGLKNPEAEGGGPDTAAGNGQPHGARRQPA